MAKQDLYKEFYIISQSVFNSILILFRMYGPYIKTILFIFLAYLAFVLGRKTVTDPLEEDFKRIKTILVNRSKYMVELPEKVERISKIRKKCLIVLILMGVIFLIAIQFRSKILKKSYKVLLMQVGLIFTLVIILIWSY